MPIRRLKTAHDIVAAIGRPRVAEMTGASQNCITNWLRDDCIPAKFCNLLSAELKRRRCSAPAHLLGQVDNQSSRAA